MLPWGPAKIFAGCTRVLKALTPAYRLPRVASRRSYKCRTHRPPTPLPGPLLQRLPQRHRLGRLLPPVLPGSTPCRRRRLEAPLQDRSIISPGRDEVRLRPCSHTHHGQNEARMAVVGVEVLSFLGREVVHLHLVLCVPGQQQLLTRARLQGPATLDARMPQVGVGGPHAGPQQANGLQKRLRAACARRSDSSNAPIPSPSPSPASRARH